MKRTNLSLGAKFSRDARFCFAGGSDRVEIAEQRYGRLDLSDELDDTEPAPEWKPRRLDGVEAHKGPPQYFTG